MCSSAGRQHNYEISKGIANLAPKNRRTEQQPRRNNKENKRKTLLSNSSKYNRRRWALSHLNATAAAAVVILDRRRKMNNSTGLLDPNVSQHFRCYSRCTLFMVERSHKMSWISCSSLRRAEQRNQLAFEITIITFLFCKFDADHNPCVSCSWIFTIFAQPRARPREFLIRLMHLDGRMNRTIVLHKQIYQFPLAIHTKKICVRIHYAD